MIRINRVVALPIDVARDEFLTSVRENCLAAVPLYDQQRTNIVGVADTDALLASPDREVRELADPALKLPAGMSMLDALSAMQRNRTRTGIVLDRQDRPSGLVTLSDLVKYLLSR